MKALYIWIKDIDSYQQKSQIRIAAYLTKLLVEFIEENLDKLDLREMYINENVKSHAMAELIWKLLTVPSSYLT